MLEAVMAWFDGHRRDLPWRREPRDPWAVLVSEVMLQQTPVARVLPTYAAWLERWPGAPDLAADAPGEAVRAWDRLGYPRRALRLHAAAVAITREHGGRLPASYDELRALPGVGDYTAAAVLAFAFRRRVAVLDTNVRRVLARACDGRAQPVTTAPSRAERDRLTELLPTEPDAAAHASEALMELGALVCTARSPHCGVCPLQLECAWVAAGRPEAAVPGTRQPTFAGSDRQVRGLIMALVRESAAPVPQDRVDQVWPLAEQRRRAQRSLAADGLIVMTSQGIRLPG